MPQTPPAGEVEDGSPFTPDEEELSLDSMMNALIPPPLADAGEVQAGAGEVQDGGVQVWDITFETLFAKYY